MKLSDELMLIPVHLEIVNLIHGNYWEITPIGTDIAFFSLY